MVFKVCHWLSLEVHFHHILERLNIHYQSIHEYEFYRYELDCQRLQSRQLFLTNRWFWSASTSQYLNPYADPHLSSRTLPAVSRGSSPCLTQDQLEHIKTVAQPNRLIVQTHDDTSYFLNDEIEMVGEWHAAMHSVSQQPQALDSSLDATSLPLSSAFGNLPLRYKSAPGDIRVHQQPDDAISCRVCQKVFAERSKLRYVVGFTCPAYFYFIFFIKQNDNDTDY
jgi:hypothetical protein